VSIEMTAPTHFEPTAGQAEIWTEAAIMELEAFCGAAAYEAARDEPLARHTSMGVGGPTPLMFWPRHPHAVAEVLEWCAARGLGWRVLGGGTNILVADAGVAEPVVNLCRLTDGVRFETSQAFYPAGLPTAQAQRQAARHGLGGLVWSTGLPGTIGGAAAGNAGCWGGQMADVVSRLEIVDNLGVCRAIEATELDWSYRRCNLQQVAGPGAAIVSLVLNLYRADHADLEMRSEHLQRKKKARQPVGARNAGCIFKNPDADNPAGLLIDDAGCKGRRIGDAQVSEMHGNFLINHGQATAAEVDELIESVKHEVREQTGIALEEEIQRW
jgi:UDP-N-acetylmuramate dehydrogenase